MTKYLLVPLLLAAPAGAVDPECVNADQTEADPAVVYDAATSFRLCAPQTDANGETLDPSELEFCSLVVDNSAFATVTGLLPGQYFTIPSPGAGKKIREAYAYCTGPSGQGPVGPTYTVRVRQEKPGKPNFK